MKRTTRSPKNSKTKNPEIHANRPNWRYNKDSVKEMHALSGKAGIDNIRKVRGEWEKVQLSPKTNNMKE